MALLRLEKVNWTDFFWQKRHLIYKLSVKKQETGRKTGQKPPKPPTPTFQVIPQTFEEWPEKLATFEDKLGQLVRGADKNTFFWRFLARFSSRFLHFHGQFVYNTDILRKKTDPAAFFSPQGPLIQSSATPQGSPPPTQQINIRNTNQLSWAIN